MSLRRGISAVWGVGIPSGGRDSAVTANQSAPAPTIDASAPACTNPQKPWSATRSVARKTIAASPSNDSATSRIWRRPRRRSASITGSDASDRVRDGWDTSPPSGPVGPSREPDHDDNPADERPTRRRWFHGGGGGPRTQPEHRGDLAVTGRDVACRA